MIIRIEARGRWVQFGTGSTTSTPNVQVGSNPPLRTYAATEPRLRGGAGFHVQPRAEATDG